jgi:RNA polymerase sigma-70 factor (ECF subfamily)
LGGEEELRSMAQADNDADIAEFDRLLRQHHTQLLGYIHSLVRDLEDSEDLFQETVITLWQKFTTFDRQQSFFAWGCGVARFKVMNYLRARGRNRLYFSDDLNLQLVTAYANLGREEFDARQAALGTCIQKLRERDRELLRICYGVAHGVLQAAQGTGRSTQSIHNSLRRIRRALFECIRRTLNREFEPEVIG